MLSSIRIKNFKSWEDTGDVRLAPLTVIFGANSAGKSSFGHLMLALKQTALSTDRKRALNLGDASSLIDLGTFQDCIHGHDLEKKLEFELRWQLPKAIKIEDAIDPSRRFQGNGLVLNATLSADKKTGQPRTTLLKYSFFDGGTELLNITNSRDDSGHIHLDLEGFSLSLARGRPWPLEEPEKFYRLSDASLARFQNAGFLRDFALETEAMLQSISYLGPLREPPKRIYSWSGDTPEDVGKSGEFAIAALLAADTEQRRLNRRLHKPIKSFASFIADWLVDLGIIHSFIVKPVAEGRKEYEVLLKTTANAPEVKITDVGFGISQILPAIVQAFYCPPNSTVWMEQPEIHLHPQVQAELADVFISAIQAREGGTPRNTQLIIESHSEHFLNRLQRRIAEDLVSPDDVAVYFASRGDSATKLEPLRLNKFGDIENWPENFFGDEMKDLTERVKAAAARQSHDLAS